MRKFRIGIDPDVNKSGVAEYDITTKEVKLYNLTFCELLKYLNDIKKDYINDYEVIIEGGWLNSSNWHLANCNQRQSAKIGNSTGRNHERGRIIAELCDYYSINYKIVKPLKKHWSGKDGKITHDELKKIIKLPLRTNQEQRDAVLLVL